MPSVLHWLAWISLVGYPIFVLIGLRAARGMVRLDAPRTRPDAPDLDPVSILKPCAGLDDGLEASLESYFALNYAAYELVFGVAEASDPAVPVIRRVIARHPERPARLRITGEAITASPKVSNLIALAADARHPLLWLSDSNTRVHPDTLRDLVETLAAPNTACVGSSIVGVGERTWGAALANLHMTTFVGCGTFTAHATTGLVGTGKSVLIPRARLDECGGLRGLGDYAGEDVVLFQRLRERGWSIALGRHLVADVCERVSLAVVLRRHLRWAAIRLRTAPIAAWFEPLLSPVVPATAFLLAARDATALRVAILAALVQSALDLMLVAWLRTPLAWRHAPLVLLRPWLLLVLWARALLPINVTWRGRTYRMRAGSRIEPLGAGEVELARDRQPV